MEHEAESETRIEDPRAPPFRHRLDLLDVEAVYKFLDAFHTSPASKVIKNFSFESAKDYLSSELKFFVFEACKCDDFAITYTSFAAIHKRFKVHNKPPKIVKTWLKKITSCEDQNWANLSESVAFALCHAVLSQPSCLVSEASAILRLKQVVDDSRMLFRLANLVTSNLKRKLESRASAGYVLQEKLRLKKEHARKIVAQMRFSRDPKKPFKVIRPPTKVVLRENCVEQEDVEDVEEIFHELHERHKSLRDNDNSGVLWGLTRCVVSHLVRQLVSLAERQLHSPVTTLAVGCLLPRIWMEMEGCQFRGKTMLQQRPSTLVDEIWGSGKDFLIAMQRRKIVRTINSISDDEIKAITSELEAGKVDPTLKILDHEPIDMITVFLLARINNVMVGIVEDRHDKRLTTVLGIVESRARYILWQKSVSGGVGGRLALLPEEECIGAYNILMFLTGKNEVQLRQQLVLFMTLHPQRLSMIKEDADWIRRKYPEEAEGLLYTERMVVGGQPATTTGIFSYMTSLPTLLVSKVTSNIPPRALRFLTDARAVINEIFEAGETGPRVSGAPAVQSDDSRYDEIQVQRRRLNEHFRRGLAVNILLLFAAVLIFLPTFLSVILFLALDVWVMYYFFQKRRSLP